MRLKDFLGHEYGPDDLVIYGAMSGRCVNMVIGRVVEIYEVYRDRDSFRWVRLDEGELPPLKTKHAWFDADGNMLEKRPESGGEWREYDTDEREDTGIRVKVQPLRGARWKQHHGRKRYIDTRTGRGINPDAPSGKHILKESHYVRADGTEYDYAAEKDRWDVTHQYSSRRSFEYYGFRARYHVNYGQVGTHREHTAESELAKEQLWWVSRTYQPWVQQVSNGPEPVTLEITDNIVKWEGVLPDAEAGAES